MSTTSTAKARLTINGKEVVNSVNEIRKAIRETKKEMNGLEQGTGAFAKKEKDLGKLETRLAQITQRQKEVRASAKLAAGGVNTISKAGNRLRAVFNKAMAALLPLLALQQFINAGKALGEMQQQYEKLRQTIKNTADLQGEALDQVVIKSTAFAETFGTSQDEAFNSAKSLVNAFKISYEEAFDIIEKGSIAAGSKQGEFLEQIAEYSVQYADAGASAQDFAVQSIQALQQGIFSDKGADVVKEFGLRIREQTNSTKDALEAAFGVQFTNRLFNNINEGSLTTVQALELVSAEMNNTQVPANKLQTVVADVFGGPGEDVGLEYLKTLQSIGGEMEDLIDTNDSYTQQQIKQLELEEKLAAAQNEVTQAFEGTGGAVSNLWTGVKIVFFETLANGIKLAKRGLIQVANFFIDLYNESQVVKAGVEGLFLFFRSAFGLMSTGIQLVVNQFRGLGKVIGAVLKGEFRSVPDIIGETFQNAKEEVKAFTNSVVEDFNNTLNRVNSRQKIQLITETENADPGQDTAAVNGQQASTDGTTPKEQRQAAQAEEIASIQAHYNKKTSLAKKASFDIVKVQEGLLKMQKDLQARQNKEIIQGEQDKWNILGRGVSSYTDMFGSALEFLGASQADMIDFNKGATLAQVAADTASAIASLTKASEANPLNAVTAGGAGIAQFLTGFARITANMVKAKQVLSKSKAPDAPKFEGGGQIEGPSHAEGGIQLTTKAGQYLGEMEGGEAILTKGISSRPDLMALVNYANMSAGGDKIYKDGGEVPGGSPAETDDMFKKAVAMFAEIVEDFPRQVEAVMTYQQLQQTINDVEKAMGPKI